MRSTRTFPPQPGSVKAARCFAAQVLGDVPPTTFESIELMISELATNCVKHGRTAFELTITCEGEQVRVEVSDDDAGEPVKRSPTPQEPTGRGLQIVEFLSDAWGVLPRDGDGKTVWLVVDRAT